MKSFFYTLILIFLSVFALASKTPKAYAAAPGTFNCGTLGGYLTCGVVNHACSPGTKPDEAYCNNISNASECDIAQNIPCIPDTGSNTADCFLSTGGTVSCQAKNVACQQGYKEPCSGRSTSNCTQTNAPCELSQSNTTDCAYNIIGNNTCEPVNSNCRPGYNAVCTSCPAKGISCVSNAPAPTISVYDPTCVAAEIPGYPGRDRTGIKTGLGCLPTDPQTFVNTVLPWAVGIGSGIAFFLGLYGALMIVISAGDPEKMQAGRELITSAVVGLLLIIFAVFLLDLIGVNILKLFTY